MIIFLLSGLWHGANWTFVIWGAYHGILFLPLILLNLNRKNLEIVASNKFLPSFKELVSILFTFLLVLIGWIIFRSENIHDALSYIFRCFTFAKGEFILRGIYTNTFSTIFMIVFLLIIEWTQRRHTFGLQIVGGKSLLFRWGLYALICFFILIFTGQQAQFIYFQF